MYIKILKKKYQEKWENAYLRVKNARAPRALRRALDPCQYWLASLAQLRFAMLARSRENFWPPLLTKSWIRYFVLTYISSTILYRSSSSFATVAIVITICFTVKSRKRKNTCLPLSPCLFWVATY